MYSEDGAGEEVREGGEGGRGGFQEGGAERGEEVRK